jgi:PPK2 family polyphosphate:nucleotide phosphotransferase
MFHADPDPLLVPTAEPFAFEEAATGPDKKTLQSRDWEDDLEREAKELARWQYRLYAEQRHAVLVVFQAMDAAGKDGTIRHVFSRVNPVGIRVTSFRQPSVTELGHDFLWRTTAQLPPRGHLGIFNRSYYEEVLTVRVHPEFLVAQGILEPPTGEFWAQRHAAIVAHERHLAEEGTVILKFWLNVSRAEQRRRLLERIEEADSQWKFSLRDLDERGHWNSYQRAFGDCLSATSRPWAPWYAIPADHKPYMRWQVARLINAAFARLKPAFPAPDARATSDLIKGKQRLADE